jgi:hypothetical protein
MGEHSGMDDKLSAQSLLLNADDVAKRCAAAADEIEAITIVARGRQWSPMEQERLATLMTETLRVVSQQNSFWSTLAFHFLASSRVWWRAWFWGLRGKR